MSTEVQPRCRLCFCAATSLIPVFEMCDYHYQNRMVPIDLTRPFGSDCPDCKGVAP
jgi:hypothetical protein